MFSVQEFIEPTLITINRNVNKKDFNISLKQFKKNSTTDECTVQNSTKLLKQDSKAK